MFKRNMFKVLLLSLLFLGSFCGSFVNAASYQPSVSILGCALRERVVEGEFSVVMFFFNTIKGNAILIKAVVSDEDPATAHTALTLAAQHGHAKIIELLYDLFKDDPAFLKELVMHKTKEGNTALMFASINGKEDVVRAIVAPFIKDKKTLKEIVKQQHTLPNGCLAYTALIFAIHFRHEKVCLVLLEPFFDDLVFVENLFMQEFETDCKMTAFMLLVKHGGNLLYETIMPFLMKDSHFFKSFLNKNLKLAQSRGLLDIGAFLEKVIKKREVSCGFCFEELKEPFFCSKCKVIAYCDRTCQQSHWVSGHKKQCKELSGQPHFVYPDVAPTGGFGGASSSH